MPMGSDGVIYGDKVINIGNHRRYSVYPKATDDGKPLKYVANGEIGIVTGPFKGMAAASDLTISRLHSKNLAGKLMA
jgi:hypothetical protein